jgi:glycosyltransferase involved in cell wall biosynthesis
MRGGVGRYTANLVSRLRKHAEVIIACDSNNVLRDNIYPITQRGNPDTSRRILSLIHDCKPDIVHVQYERGMYEIGLNTIPKIVIHRLNSVLDRLYSKSHVPVVTTLHTYRPPSSELRQFVLSDLHTNRGRLWFMPSVFLVRLKELANLPSNTFPRGALRGWIVHLAKASLDSLGVGSVIYHGAEPALTSKLDKNKLRDDLHLPRGKMLILGFGYSRSYKGFDILRHLKLPDGWLLVTKQTRHERADLEEGAVAVDNSIIFNNEYMDEQTMSRLFFACDALILPYRKVSISGVLFDGLAHGLPFVASNLSFFREFEAKGLGIVAERDAHEMEGALSILNEKYATFKSNVEQFNYQLKWDNVAALHLDLYNNLAKQQFTSRRGMNALWYRRTVLA